MQLTLCTAEWCSGGRATAWDASSWCFALTLRRLQCLSLSTWIPGEPWSLSNLDTVCPWGSAQCPEHDAHHDPSWPSSVAPSVTMQQKLCEPGPTQGIQLYNLDYWDFPSSMFLFWDLRKKFHKSNKNNAMSCWKKKLILELILWQCQQGILEDGAWWDEKSLWDTKKVSMQCCQNANWTGGGAGESWRGQNTWTFHGQQLQSPPPFAHQRFWSQHDLLESPGSDHASALRP